MKNFKIMNSVKRSISKAGFGIKKHSPEILVVAGVAGVVVSAVMACKATLKVNEILDESKETIDSIHECAENPDMKEKYTEEDTKKDLTTVYVHTGLKLAKLYAPSVIVGVMSIGGIVASNRILRKRNVALAAAYTAVDRGYKEYLGRVVERFGKEVDHELRHNIKAKEIVETVTDEKGKEKSVKKTINVADPNVRSDYAAYFMKGNPYWESTSDYNEMFLRAQQNYANDMLIAQGHLTLNEVRKSLGLEETKAGMVVGWIYNPKNPVGDNFVDFDIREVYLKDENTGTYDVAYSLDFNVDGNIYDKM